VDFIPEHAFDLRGLAVDEDPLHHVVPIVHSHDNPQLIILGDFIGVGLYHSLVGLVDGLFDDVGGELLDGELLELGHKAIEQLLTVLHIPTIESHLDCVVAVGILGKAHRVLTQLLDHLLLQLKYVELGDGDFDDREAIGVLGELIQVLHDESVDVFEVGEDRAVLEELYQDVGSMLIVGKLGQFLVEHLRYLVQKLGIRGTFDEVLEGVGASAVGGDLVEEGGGLLGLLGQLPSLSGDQSEQ